MVDESRGPVGRLIDSLAELLASLLTIGRSRLELLTLELQLEVQRLAELGLLAFVAIFSSGVALLLAGLAVILVFWETHRVMAALVVTAVFLLAAGVSIGLLVAKLRRKPRMLESTLAELARDSERLGGRP